MKLKECCTLFVDGDWIESKDQSPEGIRLVQTGNIGNGRYLEKESRAKYISEETFERLSCTEIFPSDILVSRLPDPVGRACIIPEKQERMITAVDCSILRVNEEIVLKRYLLHFLKSNAYFNQLASKLAGTTRTRISRKNLEQVYVPIPSMEKQHNIVSVLDKLVDIINAREEQLVELDNLVKARFVEMFGDVKAEDTLANLCTFIDYRGKTPEKTDSGLPFITAKNVKMHHMSFDTQEFISKETYDKVMTRGFPKIGDVVFTTEAPLGNVCRIPYIETEFYIGQRIITMQTTQLAPAYLEYALASDAFRRKIDEKSSGSTVTGIRSKLLEQLTIPVPPIARQEQFAAFVAQVDKSKVAVQKALDEVQTLFDSLMQQYFG